MRILVEYKPEFAYKNRENPEEKDSEIEFLKVKSVVDGPDLFPEFIEIRTENDQNGGRKRVYIDKKVVKKFEIHEK